MNEQHATTSSNGRPTRNRKGQFLKGNPGGPGNPFGRQMAALRSALFQAVTPEEIRTIAEDLVCQAKLGNFAAIKLLFLYVIGKPTPPVDPDRVDLDEWQLEQESAVSPDEIQPLLATVPPKRATVAVRENHATIEIGLQERLGPCRPEETPAAPTAADDEDGEMSESSARAPAGASPAARREGRARPAATACDHERQSMSELEPLTADPRRAVNQRQFAVADAQRHPARAAQPRDRHPTVPR